MIENRVGHSANTTALVSIVCNTYNHEPFIKQCLDGFVMQKTNFPIEILVHDDASTDQTAAIIRDYELNYPGIIKPIYQTENQHSQKRRITTGIQYPRVKGKYIALCEGDDYWTDPLKLQKQVDYMDANPDCSLCFHASKTIRNNDQDNFVLNRPSPIPVDSKFEMKHVILGGGGLMATNSMLYRTACSMDRPEWMNDISIGDLPLMLLLASRGKLGYIDEIMSTYRFLSSPTSWSASMQNRQRRRQHHYDILKMWTAFDKWTNRRYHSYVQQKKRLNTINYYKRLIIRFIKKNLFVKNGK